MRVIAIGHRAISLLSIQTTMVLVVCALIDYIYISTCICVCVCVCVCASDTHETGALPLLAAYNGSTDILLPIPLRYDAHCRDIYSRARNEIDIGDDVMMMMMMMMTSDHECVCDCVFCPLHQENARDDDGAAWVSLPRIYAPAYRYAFPPHTPSSRSRILRSGNSK